MQLRLWWRSLGKSFTQQVLQPTSIAISKTQRRPQAATGFVGIGAADGFADREKGFRQRRCNAGKLCDRDEERQTEPQVFQHVAMLGQYDPFPPIAGIS